MVENLSALKQSGIPKHTSQLLDAFSSLLAFERKLEDFTVAKCAFERNMETCIIERLYFGNRKQAILTSVKSCWEQQCPKSEP